MIRRASCLLQLALRSVAADSGHNWNVWSALVQSWDHCTFRIQSLLNLFYGHKRESKQFDFPRCSMPTRNASYNGSPALGTFHVMTRWCNDKNMQKSGHISKNDQKLIWFTQVDLLYGNRKKLKTSVIGDGWTVMYVAWCHHENIWLNGWWKGGWMMDGWKPNRVFLVTYRNVGSKFDHDHFIHIGYVALHHSICNPTPCKRHRSWNGFLSM